MMEHTEILICFLFAIVAMIAAHVQLVWFGRSRSFLFASWIVFFLLLGLGTYAMLSFSAHDTRETFSQQAIMPYDGAWNPDDADRATEADYRQIVAGAPAGKTVYYWPIVWFQTVLLLFFVGIYFAAKSDWLREKFRRTEELLEETTHSWVQSQNEAGLARQTTDNILANMNHEIRTPLNAILGLTQVLEMNFRQTGEKEERSQQEEIFGMIQQSGNDLVRLVDNILLLSSLDSQQVRIQWSSVDFRDFLARLENEIRRRGGAEYEKRFQPSETVLDENFPAKLITDPYGLRTILLNLWENALKFGGGKKVSVRFQIEIQPAVREKLEYLSQDRWFQFSPATLTAKITDEGIGIGPEQVEKIFEPFYQIDSTSTRKQGGLGLGLAISDRLTRLLGGELKVESRPNEGTQFTVAVPTWVVP